MENIYEMNLLLDYYGHLLTKRQSELMDLYYNDDLSLAEISQTLGISRQGAHDGIKKAREYLYNIEGKMGLVNRHLRQEKKVFDAIECIDTIKKKLQQNEYQNVSLSLDSDLDDLQNQLRNILLIFEQ